MGSSKINFSLAAEHAAAQKWKISEGSAPFEYILRDWVRGNKWQFSDFARFLHEFGTQITIHSRPYTICDLCGWTYWIMGDDPDNAQAIKRWPLAPDQFKILMFREYVGLVKWQFAKTYAETSPHEYTVGKWKPGFQYKMNQVAWFIKGHGELEIFSGYPYVVYFLDGWKYWTMDDDPEATTLINRTPVGGY